MATDNSESQSLDGQAAVGETSSYAAAWGVCCLLPRIRKAELVIMKESMQAGWLLMGVLGAFNMLLDSLLQSL